MKLNLEEKIVNGEKISPALSEGIKDYLIDIDGTICDDIPNEEAHKMASAKVFPDDMEILNNWFDEVRIITFFTSRLEEHRVVIEKWLNENGFNFHGIVINKPRVGNYHWVDNHIVRATKYDRQFYRFSGSKYNN
jgi:hypothetical protein